MTLGVCHPERSPMPLPLALCRSLRMTNPRMSSWAQRRISGAFIQPTSLTWPCGLLGNHRLLFSWQSHLL